jgi:hypothetical protein
MHSTGDYRYKEEDEQKALKWVEGPADKNRGLRHSTEGDEKKK